MELAILRTLKRTGEDKVIEKFDHAQFFNRLESLVLEKLPQTKVETIVVRRWPRKTEEVEVKRTSWSEEEIRRAYRQAFGALIRELRKNFMVF